MIIAIDPSINHIGWAVGPDKWIFGTINVKGGTIPEKLMQISQKVMKLCWDAPCPMSTAVIEIPGKITYSRSTARSGGALNSDAIHKLCMATGAIILCLEARGVDVELVVADEWKRSFSRRQFAAGKDYFKMVAKGIVGREVKTDHEADAICLLWWWTQGNTRKADVNQADTVKP